MLLLFANCTFGDRDAMNTFPPGQEGNFFHVIVETSAGEHLPRFYNPLTGTIEVDSSEHEVTEAFLPYPINAGFIPKLNTDGDLDPISVWLLCGRKESGYVAKCKPLALLEFARGGQRSLLFLMAPIRQELDVYNIESFEDLAIEHDALKFGLEHWVRNVKGTGSVSHLRWGDEIEARQLLDEQFNK